MSSLVGKKAPSFKAGAITNGGTVVSDFSLDQFTGKKKNSQSLQRLLAFQEKRTDQYSQ